MLPRTLFVVLISALLLVTPHVYAQDAINSISNSQFPMSNSLTPTPVPYTLPYPGLLPDSPLYKFKVFRDFVVNFLISDPTKRADFDILQSDKRFAGAIMLYDARHTQLPLVLTTISKGNNYMDGALSSLLAAKKQGASYQDVAQKGSLSNLKHLELLNNLKQQAGDSKQIDTEIQRVMNFSIRFNSEVL